MRLTTVNGYRLVNTDEYNTATYNLKNITIFIQPLRESILRDISLLNRIDKNTFARSIRLLDRFRKELDNLKEEL